MAAFLGHASAVPQLQSHQLLLLQQGASTETEGLSPKHTRRSQQQGRGTWPRPQDANLTVGLGKAPLPTTQPRSGWTGYVQDRTEKCICTRARWVPTHQCHPPCVLCVPWSPFVQYKQMATHCELSHSCARDQLLCLGIWDILSIPPMETLQAGPRAAPPQGKPGVHTDVKSNSRLTAHQ